MASYDIIGSIAIIKSETNGKRKTIKQKLEEAKELLKQPSIKTVLEKSENIKGRLRKFKAKYIAGEKNTITIHKENKCRFRLDVNTCYFSPRLSNDRKEISGKIRKTDNVLVMFSGIGAYPIVFHRLAQPRKITAIEISRECNKYFKENLLLNKISKKEINIIQGDVKKKIPLLKEKFDVIMMARPNLTNTFLKQALLVSKKGTRILYHGFCKNDELLLLKRQLLEESSSFKRKIKITGIKKAGEIAPYKFRYRIEMKVIR